jgi:hypothetical protein
MIRLPMSSRVKVPSSTRESWLLTSSLIGNSSSKRPGRLDRCRSDRAERP